LPLGSKLRHVTLTRHDTLPQTGASFAGKYTMGRVLGQGGVGVVFEAFHQRLNQRVAIKILRAEVRRSAEWLARFDREARAAVKLRGPNVAHYDRIPFSFTHYLQLSLKRFALHCSHISLGLGFSLVVS